MLSSCSYWRCWQYPPLAPKPDLRTMPKTKCNAVTLSWDTWYVTHERSERKRSWHILGYKLNHLHGSIYRLFRGAVSAVEIIKLKIIWNYDNKWWIGNNSKAESWVVRWWPDDNDVSTRADEPPLLEPLPSNDQGRHNRVRPSVCSSGLLSE
jgi:hypothetical protein